MAPESIPACIGSSSGTFKAVIKDFTLSPPKILIKSSSRETKNCEDPGSPCLPALPLSWSSILLASCLSVPITQSPPSSLTVLASSIFGGFPPKIISTPRPAIFVAIVTAPFLPACAIISPSLS